MTCKDCIHNDVCRGVYLAIQDNTKLTLKEFQILCEKEDFDNQDIALYDCLFFQDRSRYVELPCKVGDTVYFILRSFDGKMRINPEKVCYLTIDANELRIHTTAGYFTERDMNDGVFFTRERAEQALKEREKDE